MNNNIVLLLAIFGLWFFLGIYSKTTNNTEQKNSGTATNGASVSGKW